jgi:hypothetical protein
MMDDLRDYRFYRADMIHPNEVAEDYIFEKFAQTYFDNDLKTFLLEWKNIKKALNHRPFNEKTAAHQQFLEKLLMDLKRLNKEVTLTEEIEEVEKRFITV